MKPKLLGKVGGAWQQVVPRYPCDQVVGLAGWRVGGRSGCGAIGRSGDRAIGLAGDRVVGRSGCGAIGWSGDRGNCGMWPGHGNRELAGDGVNLRMPCPYG
ncbi:MAG: hypothetical protein AB4352_13015 [Hormoscilla sp.]